MALGQQPFMPDCIKGPRNVQCNSYGLVTLVQLVGDELVDDH